MLSVDEAVRVERADLLSDPDAGGWSAQSPGAPSMTSGATPRCSWPSRSGRRQPYLGIGYGIIHTTGHSPASSRRQLRERAEPPGFGTSSGVSSSRSARSWRSASTRSRRRGRSGLYDGAADQCRRNRSPAGRRRWPSAFTFYRRPAHRPRQRPRTARRVLAPRAGRRPNHEKRRAADLRSAARLALPPSASVPRPSPRDPGRAVDHEPERPLRRLGDADARGDGHLRCGRLSRARTTTPDRASRRHPGPW